MKRRTVTRTERSAAATWLEQLKELDRALSAALDARVIVQLCEARDKHMASMPPAATVYGFN